VTHFFIHLGGVGDRVGDFLAQQLAIALTQAVHGHFDGPFGHAELRGQFGVGLRLPVSHQARFERVEHLACARREMLVAQRTQDLIQQRQRPAPFEALLGCQRVRWFLAVARFR
jgi:hypothetical protein